RMYGQSHAQFSVSPQDTHELSRLAGQTFGHDLAAEPTTKVPALCSNRDTDFLTHLIHFSERTIMKISMYQASVPTFIRMLNNLSAVLDKGAAHADAKKIEPAVLINARLYPDMLPLVRQVQIAADNAKG